MQKERFLPREEMLELKQNRKQLYIGIPKETKEFENRVSLTPQSVEILVQNGHSVMLERNAGKGSKYSDSDYSEVGAYITDSKNEIFKNEIILKTAPFALDEIQLLKKGQTVFSPVHITAQTVHAIKTLMKKNVTAIAYEYLKGENDDPLIVRSMDEISGNSAIMIAAKYLSNENNGKGVLLGGITGVTPTEIVILGAETAAECAAKTALGLGATVKVFDKSLHKLRKIQNALGQKIFTSVMHPPVLQKAFLTADVVIGAIPLSDIENFIICEETIKNMKPDSVIIDLGVDNSPCFETSRLTTIDSPVFKKFGVIHYCVPNIASNFGRTASIALSNVFSPLLLQIGDSGGIKQQIKYNDGLRSGIYIYNGILTNQYIGEKFNLDYKNIDLLTAAF